MQRLFLVSVAVATMLLVSHQANAQWVVPHTTTHTDLYQHGNHVHAVPHTTTHYDQVSPYSGGTVYQSQRPVITQGYNQGYSSGYSQGQIVYPNQGQVYSQSGVYQSNYNQPYQSYRPAYPQVHQSTHIDYVPHTTTHTDYYRHGNHIDAVPHTTTHIDAVPHTTPHVHYYGN